MEKFFEANLPINKNRKPNPNFIQPQKTVFGFEYTTAADPNKGQGGGGGTFGDEVKKYTDGAKQAEETYTKLEQGWNNFKEWSGIGSKRYTTNKPVVYFWKNGAGQPNEGKYPEVEQASIGWIKEVYEKELAGDLGYLGLDEATKNWIYYADLLPFYDKNGLGLKGLFTQMKIDIDKEKKRLEDNAIMERQNPRSYIRGNANYPKSGLIIPDPETGKDITGEGTGGGTGTGGGGLEQAMYKPLSLLDKLVKIFLGETDTTGKTKKEVEEIEAKKKTKFLMFSGIALIAVIITVYYLRNKKS